MLITLTGAGSEHTADPGVSRDGLENLENWLGQMKTGPACQNGIKVPAPPKTMLEGEEQKSFVKGAQPIVQR